MCLQCKLYTPPRPLTLLTYWSYCGFNIQTLDRARYLEQENLQFKAQNAYLEKRVARTNEMLDAQRQRAASLQSQVFELQKDNENLEEENKLVYANIKEREDEIESLKKTVSLITSFKRFPIFHLNQIVAKESLIQWLNLNILGFGSIASSSNFGEEAWQSDKWSKGERCHIWLISRRGLERTRRQGISIEEKNSKYRWL